METKISVSAHATPDTQEYQSSRKFNLGFEVEIDGNNNLARLSDAEIFDLIYAQTVDAVRQAAGNITAHNRSKLSRPMAAENSVSLAAKFTSQPRSGGKFTQHQDIKGHIIIDAEGPVNTGESWILGQPECVHAVAENVASNVLIGLGREAVEITQDASRSGQNRTIDTKSLY